MKQISLNYGRGLGTAGIMSYQALDVDLTKRIEGDQLCSPEDPLKPSCCECYKRNGNFELFIISNICLAHLSNLGSYQN